MLNVVDALRTDPDLRQAYRRPTETAPAAIRKLVICVENLADEFCCRPGVSPPLTVGALLRLMACENRTAFGESWIAQVTRHAVTTDEGVHRHRVVLSDGANTVRATVDSQLHDSLCTGTVENAVWCISSAVLHVDDGMAEGDVSIIVTVATRLLGFQRLAAAWNGDDLVPCRHAPASATADAAMRVEIEDPGIPEGDPTWYFVPATACDGCGCDCAFAKDETGSVIPETTYPCNRPASTCRAADLPSVAEVWDNMVDNWPRKETEVPRPDDPMAAIAARDPDAARSCRFAIYYYLATNWYDCRGKGNRIMLPTCLWAAIRRAYPEPRSGPGYSEEVHVPGADDEDWQDEESDDDTN